MTCLSSAGHIFRVSTSVAESTVCIWPSQLRWRWSQTWCMQLMEEKSAYCACRRPLTQMTTRYWLVICSNCSGSREWLFPRSSPFCRTKPSLSALMGCSRPDHYWPVASHKEAFSDLCFSLPIVSVMTSLQSPNDVVLNCTHMKTTLRCFHADPTSVDSKMQQLVACDGEIGQWMCANRLKLNKI